MAHITLNSDEPGIRGLFLFRPQTARPLNELAEVLLRGPNTLTRGERELIASYVSSLNQCKYCASSHSAFAAAQLPEGMPLVQQVRTDFPNAPLAPKLRALLDIAAAVQKGGLAVTSELADAARAQGATDTEIHDCVLIAAAFCMFNRYVDGLGTFAPDDPGQYSAGAQRIVDVGYLGLLAESQQALSGRPGEPGWGVTAPDQSFRSNVRRKCRYSDSSYGRFDTLAKSRLDEFGTGNALCRRHPVQRRGLAFSEVDVRPFQPLHHAPGGRCAR